MIDVKASGKAIKELMKKRNIPARYVCDQLDLREISVYNWRRGAKLPSIDHLVELTHILDCKLEDIVKEYDPNQIGCHYCKWAKLDKGRYNEWDDYCKNPNQFDIKCNVGIGEECRFFESKRGD